MNASERSNEIGNKKSFIKIELEGSQNEND